MYQVSMTAPAMRRSLRASYSDRSSIVGPRPTFSITADARIAAKDSAFTIPTVSAFDGIETTKKSAELQNSPSLFRTNERSTRDDVGTGLRLAT